MKKPLMLILAVGILIGVAGCASHELQLKLSGAKMLNQVELEQLFYADRVAEFSSPEGSATVTYYPDGRQDIEWKNGKDSGSFRIENDEFCSTWTRLRNGLESCSKIYRIDAREYEFVSPDGEYAASMHLKLN
ncbi:MAG: hypothetical protein ACM3KE_00700 [Hyphomicrobiales bacterium]